MGHPFGRTLPYQPSVHKVHHHCKRSTIILRVPATIHQLTKMATVEIPALEQADAPPESGLSPASKIPLNRAFRLFTRSMEQISKSTEEDEFEMSVKSKQDSTSEIAGSDEQPLTSEDDAQPEEKRDEEDTPEESKSSEEKQQEEKFNKLLAPFPLRLARSFQKKSSSMDPYPLNRSKSSGNQLPEADKELNLELPKEKQLLSGGIPLVRRLSFRGRKEKKEQEDLSKAEEKESEKGEPPLPTSPLSKPPRPFPKSILGRYVHLLTQL